VRVSMVGSSDVKRRTMLTFFFQIDRCAPLAREGRREVPAVDASGLVPCWHAQWSAFSGAGRWAPFPLPPLPRCYPSRA
jgi:hypothetical protein